MKRILCIFAIAVIVTATVFAQQDLQPVAIVRLSKSQPISVKEFKDYVNWMNLARAQSPNPADHKPLTTEERKAILDTLCNQLLACQAAEQEKINVTETEINQQFNAEMEPVKAYLAQRLGHAPSDAELDAEIKSQTGMSRAVFRELVRRSLLTNKYLMAKKQSFFETIKPPSDSEVMAVYNEGKSKSLLDAGFIRPDTIRIKMIVVPYQNPAAKTAARQKAEQLLRLIGGDAGKFDEVAEDSRKANSGYMGGDGPYIYRDSRIKEQMGAPFFDTAFSLKQGEVSGILERPDAFYIIKVTETLRQKTLGLDDIYQLGDPRKITVRDAIKFTEGQKRQMDAYQTASMDLVNELKKKGSVQLMDKTYNSIVW